MLRTKGTPGFTDELRGSPQPALLLLTIVAVVLGVIAFDLRHSSEALNLSLICGALTVTSWVVHSYNKTAGSWLTSLSMSAVIVLGHLWLGTPGLLPLLAVPVALTALLLGPLSMLLSLLLHSLANWVLIAGGLVAFDVAAVALGVMWLIAATVTLVYRPIMRLGEWYWENYREATAALDEARERQVELKDTLDALAHANRQLALMNDRLAAARLAAEEAQKARTAFVAKVSHEFRTPLNMIIGLADVLLEAPEVYDTELPPRLMQDLEILQRNAEHLASMVNDVLDLSQVTEGRLVLHREYVDLSTVVGEALAVVKPLLEKKALTLEVDLPDDLDPVYCDRTRIRQVVLNLVSNAARFTERGGIQIQLLDSQNQVELRVADTGPGIAATDLERIFEPFEQATLGKRLWPEGSGLGLSISKQFIELHGGRIWVESEVGRGSVFRVSLPKNPLTGLEASAHRYIAPDWEERRTREEISRQQPLPRILVYDETNGVYPTLTRYVQDLELVPSDGPSAVENELEEHAAAAVMVNASAPERLWSLMDRYRKVKGGVPVVGFAVPPRMGLTVSRGAYSYLLKPITRQAVSSSLASLHGPMQRVLIVDDDPDALEVLTRLLLSYDPRLNILTTTNPQQSLALLREWQPDLLLLDVIMPKMDGWQVLAEKNQDPLIAEIPVIMISAQDPREEPLASPVLAVAMPEEMPITRLLRLSRAFLQPEQAPEQAHDPAPQ